jgi:hypothetical protein
MPDIAHTMGSDLLVDATGDIQTSDGLELGQERVLRRLFTAPFAYVWSPDYGAGLARFLGNPMASARIAAVTRAQMFQEASVARSPAPIISVQARPDGTVLETIQYVDTTTQQVSRVTPFTVSPAGAQP